MAKSTLTSTQIKKLKKKRDDLIEVRKRLRKFFDPDGIEDYERELLAQYDEKIAQLNEKLVERGVIDRGEVVGVDGPFVEIEGSPVNLPERRNPSVQFIDHDTGDCPQMSLRDVLKSPDYIDNWIRLEAQPHWVSLKVDEIRFVYQGGRALVVPWKAISSRSKGRAKSYERRKKLIYPHDSSGKILYDVSNTPNIVAAAEWLTQVIQRLHKERIELATIVNAFAQIIKAGGTGDTSWAVEHFVNQHRDKKK